MQIIINTADDLSPKDLSILSALVGETSEEQTALDPVPAAKPKTAAKPKPEPVVEEDLVGGETHTMADAVKLATELVSDGKAGKVKEALAKFGAKRVSELKEGDITAFVTSLS